MSRFVKIKSLVILAVVVGLGIDSVKAANFYWVGGTGNWSDYANHWATSSGGGTFHSNAPTSSDDVFFDANSFSAGGQTVTLDVDATCNNIDWTGATNNPTITASSSFNELEVYGNFTSIAAMTWDSGLGEIEFMGASGTKTITTNGLSIASEFEFIGDATFELADAVTLTNGITFSGFCNGTFNTQNYAVTCSYLRQDVSSSTLNFGTSTITLIPTVNADDFSETLKFYSFGTVSASSATFVIDNNSSYTVYVEMDAKTIGAVYFQDSGYSINIEDAGTINTLTLASQLKLFFSAGFTLGDVTFAAESEVSFASGASYSITGTMTANGDCLTYIFMHSNAAGTAAILNVTSAQSIDNVIVTDITANVTTGTITCDECANVSGNTGGSNDWNFTNTRGARTLYWIGNTGNWSDKDNWSTNSDGTASNSHTSGTGECLPNFNDNVVFNANSFGSDGQTITMDDFNNFSGDIDFTAIDQNITVALSSGSTASIYGSWTGDPSLTQSMSGTVYWYGGSANETITSDGEAFGTVIFQGAGTYHLEDNFDVNGNLIINSGVLDAQNNGATTVYDINVSGEWENGVGAAAFTERTSTVTFDGSSIGEINGTFNNDETFYNVTLNKASSFTSVYVWGVNVTITNQLLVTSGDFNIWNISGTNTIELSNLCQINGGELTISGSANNIVLNLAEDLNLDAGNVDIGSGDVNLSKDIDIDGGKMDISGGTVDVTGDALGDNGVSIVSGELELDGGTLTVGTGTSQDVTVASGTYDHNTGTVTVAHQFNMTSGTFDMAGGTLNVGATATSGDGTDRLTFSGGTYSLTNGTIDIQSSGDNGGADDYAIDIQAGATVGTVTEGNHTFQITENSVDSYINVHNTKRIANLELNCTGRDVFLADALDIDGAFTLTDGQLDMNGNNVELSRDWTNNSAADGLITTTESVTFDGSSASQNIAGSASTTFHDLIINNTFASGEVDLDVLTNVNGTVTLTQGDIEALDFSLSCTSDDLPGFSGGAANAHINGTLIKVYNTTAAATFPLGDGTNYNPLMLTPSGSDTWTLGYYDDAPSEASTLCEADFDYVSPTYYWNISPSGASNAVIRMYWNASNTVVEGEVGDYGLMIGHRSTTCDGGSPGWELPPGNTKDDFTISTVDAGDTQGYIETNNAVTSFSAFTFASGKSVTFMSLPVEFVDVSANLMDNDYVEVSWITASELNNDYFVVERLNNLSQEFDSIGYVLGAGTTTQVSEYLFVDDFPQVGKNIYRIKQVDFDLAYDYSGEVSVTTVTQMDFSIYPNPSKGEYVLMNVGRELVNETSLLVTDISGRTCLARLLDGVAGQLKIDFNTTLAPGTYFVTLSNSSFSKTEKLVVSE